MKRHLLVITTMVSSVCLSAQDAATADTVVAVPVSGYHSVAKDFSGSSSSSTFTFAYFSYEKALKSIPAYQMVEKSLAELRKKFEAEQQRVEQDFNLKYEEFLEGQRDFPETILRKRQTELKELMERNIAFKAQCREELAKAEAAAMAPLKEKLASAVSKIGMEHHYAFILNIDGNTVPFIYPSMGVDISQQVYAALR
jgi:outer membrane protein